MEKEEEEDEEGQGGGRKRRREERGKKKRISSTSENVDILKNSVFFLPVQRIQIRTEKSQPGVTLP